MFVALRDLRFARGRFVLIGAVVGMITVLVGFLSGLTGGLAAQNVSAILAIPADRIVFSEPGSGASEVSFADSAITERQARAWEGADAVAAVRPLGISQARAEVGDVRASVALFGGEAELGITPPSRDGLVTLTAPAAESLGANVGDETTVAGATYVVEAIEGEAWYSHTPVALITLADWQRHSAATGSPDPYATVLAVTATEGAEVEWEGIDRAHETAAQTTLDSLMAVSAFRSEIGSLLLMVTMLFGISGLVIGAFFTVWTMQRKGDIAVLKALGASTSSLVRDALGQALVVLLAGIGSGIALVATLGAAAGTALPFLLSPVTTVAPGVIMIALGLAGAAVALRSVVSADPLTALGSNR
ncbi:FtsX-like permease family protein [Demequina sp. SO4-18]|uniref:FtsX-like permease family protein n=1 Tax=Demequina sp. SO4-18 TaxID=3401026 RepID=UPI003B59AC81